MDFQNLFLSSTGRSNICVGWKDYTQNEVFRVSKDMKKKRGSLVGITKHLVTKALFGLFCLLLYYGSISIRAVGLIPDNYTTILNRIVTPFHFWQWEQVIEVYKILDFKEMAIILSFPWKESNVKNFELRGDINRDIQKKSSRTNCPSHWSHTRSDCYLVGGFRCTTSSRSCLTSPSCY